jgi:hypothetical protein
MDKMRARREIVRALFLLISLSPFLLFAQGKSAQETEASCRRFAQAFYDWYVPKALKDHRGPASDLALRYRRTAFSAELVQKLSEDSAAQAKASEIVGLDFDPFLNSQDPSERFVVGGVTRRGDKYFVEVRGIQSGKAQENVVPELVLTKTGHWRFANFHYGPSKSSADENLLSILDSLRRERLKNEK